VAFGNDMQMPAIQVPANSMPAQLRGYVDRVDSWNCAGSNYFRVVDYKTGKKDFDYCDVFNGMGLQLLLYMFALEQGGQKVLGKHPTPAGVQYFAARVPILSADGILTDEQVDAERMKKWKRSGLLLNSQMVLQALEPGDKPQRMDYTVKDGVYSGDLADTAQFQLLHAYVFRLLGKMVDDIASGNVEPNPYTRGTAHSACAFCPYGAICHEATVEGRRNYKTMTDQRFWEEIERGTSHGG
jgi:ATP-dependent helicase/nuclease subunit B